MTCIGNFKQTENGWAGKITTVTFNRQCALVPNPDKTEDSEQPDYRVMSGPAEIGAGWKKSDTEDGRCVVSVRINAPVAGRFNALLVQDKSDSADGGRGDNPDKSPQPIKASLYFRN